MGWFQRFGRKPYPAPVRNEQGRRSLIFRKVKEVKAVSKGLPYSTAPAATALRLRHMFLFFSLIQSNDSRKFSGLRTFDRARPIIYKNYSYPLTIPRSPVCGVTRSQPYFQTDPWGLPQVFNRIRLQNAVRLMRTTDLSVTEILYSCGFNRSQPFSRQFKLRYGVTPSEHLKTVRKSGLPAPISD